MMFTPTQLRSQYRAKRCAACVGAVLFASLIALPLGCTSSERADRNLPPPAYLHARDLYPSGGETSADAGADGQRYDTGDYVTPDSVTADRDGPDAQTFDGGYADAVTPRPTPQQEYYYDNSGYLYDGPVYPGIYGYAYDGGSSAFYRRRDFERRHDRDYFYRRNNRDDVHYARDARREDDRDRDPHIDRSPREPTPRETSPRVPVASDRPRVGPVRDARQAINPNRDDAPRVDPSNEPARGRADAPRDASRDVPSRADRSAARDDRPTRDTPARDAPARDAPSRNAPDASSNRRGGTDPAPTRDTPRSPPPDNTRRR